jgi:hypothetical protein
MSAENKLDIYRMSNNQYWIACNSTGNVCAENEGKIIGCAISKLNSYAEALNELGILEDPDSDRYYYTEYTCGYPLTEWDMPTHFVRSLICVEYVGKDGSVSGRGNGCLLHSYLRKKQWRVTELDLDTRESRILVDRAWYSQAITLAHTYARREPGCVKLDLPDMFYRKSRKDEDADSCCWEGVAMDLPPCE